MSSTNLMRWGKTIYDITKLKVFTSRSAKTRPSPLGRWIVNDDNWEIRAEYATSDSCGGNLCSKPFSIHKNKPCYSSKS